MTSPGARAAPGPVPGLLAARGTLRLTLAVAAAMLAIGVLLLSWPDESLVVTAVLLGTALLVTGARRLVQAATAGSEAGAHRAGSALIGILAVLAGIYCLGDTAAPVVLLSLVVGLFWAMHGLVDLVAASSPGPGRVLAGPGGGHGHLAGLRRGPARGDRAVPAPRGQGGRGGRVTTGPAGAPGRSRPGGTGRRVSGRPSGDGSSRC
jgi:uncharacterized membrane protein HdeD (DUF308 family)